MSADSWREIAETTEMDVRECTKWKNLRDNYARHKKEPGTWREKSPGILFFSVATYEQDHRN